MLIAGNYHDGKTSRSVNAHLEVLYDDLVARISLVFDDEPAGENEGYPLNLNYSELKVASRLGNTPREISFGDGCLFITEDNDSVDYLIKHHGKSGSESLLHRLETNTPLILVSIIVTIVVVWGTVIYGIPASAKFIAFQLPDFTTEKLGSSLSVLDKTVFDESELSASRQAEIRQLTAPYLDVYKNLYPKLEFRSGMKANALALPSGEIVLTDGFVNLVENDQELLAVFFHEIGHLKHKHLLRRALQDSMVTLMVIFVTGDVDSFDLLTGLPTLILDLSYSREFEREADIFALEQLHRHEIPVDHFATVMERLENYYAEKSEAEESAENDDKPSDESSNDFFSTHPGTDERVKLIKQFKQIHQIK